MRDIKNLKGRRIVYRAAYEVTLEKVGKHYEVGDDFRIVRTFKTLDHLLKNKCSIVVLSYLKRPGGKVVDKWRLDPIARYLSKALKLKVKYVDDCVGPKAEKAVAALRPGEILVLENTRFHPEEEENDPAFAKRLASYGEIYVNDAFAQDYKPHASTTAITKFLPSYAGFLLEEEINELNGALNKPKGPAIAIIGGVKISAKLGVVEKLLKKFDDILLGGALVNTVLKAQGVAVGKSLIEPAMVKQLEDFNFTNPKLHIPVDVMVGKSFTKGAKAVPKAVGSIGPKEWILDIGPDTIRLFDSIIREAKTIVWDGPMGVFEFLQFAKGTESVIHALVHSDAKIVIGGGETIDVFRKFSNKTFAQLPNIYVSTGGAAMLKFLEGKTLPAVSPLLKNN